jgi:hypothetical protein
MSSLLNKAFADFFFCVNRRNLRMEKPSPRPSPALRARENCRQILCGLCALLWLLKGGAGFGLLKKESRNQGTVLS